MRYYILFLILGILLITQNILAQDLQVGNQFIIGDVEPKSGHITVLPVDKSDHGHIGLDKQLSFQYKSFFTCQIGNQFFTNNDVIAPFPQNAFHLNDGTSLTIKDPNKISDTIRTTWLNKNGVDIIQDVYPIAFTKSGQVVYKWNFVNHNSSPITIACQYLEDIQITDPSSPFGNVSNDGPIILTRWQYKPSWEQYPNSIFPTLPWFYIGFLFDLPHPVSFDPGLSAMGYLDYGEPLNLIAPFRMTTGDWYTLANTIFGTNPAWPMNSSTTIGQDCAVLTEFAPRAIQAGKKVEVARTSYGTGEYEKCVGNLFSLVFYPHHIAWDSKSMTYSPNPIHIEKFVVDPSKTNGAPNTKITLSVSKDLTLVDSVCDSIRGKSLTKPDTTANGEFIGPGFVAYFDWWACASPALFCTGPIIDTLTFTANDPLGAPSFLDSLGNNDCQQLVTLDCAESDVNPPQFVDTLIVHDSSSIAVRDWRTTDRGLQSITWTAQSGTDTTKFKVLPPTPAILPCYNDKKSHIVKLIQLDSTIGGCYDFTFTDCLGYQSYHTVCMPAHPLQIFHPDSLPPIFSFISKTGNRDTSLCSGHIDSFIVTDSRLRDSGVCMLDTIAGSVQNMIFIKAAFISGTPVIGFIVSVIDSLFDGNICIRATDCASPPHIVDTCFHYCAAIQGSVSGENKTILSLEANHPNPFSHITTFTYSIPDFGMTRLTLYNELGKEVARIVDGAKQQGTYSTDFDGSKLPSGSYIVKLESGKEVVSRKVIIER